MYTVSMVKGVDPDGTVLMGCRTDACQGCKAGMFCNNKGLTEFSALNPKEIEVKVGDMVELYMPPGRTILSTALVFALPLALFPIGYLILRYSFPGLGEMYCALGGFGAMAVAFGIASVITVRHRMRLMPVITRVVGMSPEEAEVPQAPNTDG